MALSVMGLLFARNTRFVIRIVFIEQEAIRDIEEYVKGDLSKASPVWITMDDKYRLDGVQYFKDNPDATDWDFVIASYRHYYLKVNGSLRHGSLFVDDLHGGRTPCNYQIQ